jgi:hypothetical protein
MESLSKRNNIYINRFFRSFFSGPLSRREENSVFLKSSSNSIFQKNQKQSPMKENGLKYTSLCHYFSVLNTMLKTFFFGGGGDVNKSSLSLTLDAKI